MKILLYLYYCSKRRFAWALLAIIAFILEIAALYFQYALGYQPCVLCIYQRVALFGVLFSGLLGTSIPSSIIVRGSALTLWLYSSYQGLSIAWQHTMMVLNPSPFELCDLFANFPNWLPLSTWFPGVFQAHGQCTATQWQFLGLIMPQWVLIIFALSFSIGILVLLSQIAGLISRNK